METFPSSVGSAARAACRVAAKLCCVAAVVVLAGAAPAADRARPGAPDRAREAIAYRRCAGRLRAVTPGARPRTALHGCAAPASGAYAAGWSAVHADGANTDYTPVPGARDLTLAWERRLPGGINLGPTIDPTGRVYVTHNADDAGCHLHALDGRTGEEVWCSAEVDRFAVASSPLLDRDGRLFVADSEAMHAFDRDGRLLWKTPIVGVPLSAQFTPEGRLLFMTHVGVVYVLRRDTGAPMLPPYALIPGATWTPADGMNACLIGTPRCPAANTLAVDRTGRFFFTFWAPGSPQAGVRAMRYVERPAPALVPLWTNDSLPGGSASSPDVSADGARLYVTDNVDAVHALATDTGETVWTYRIGFAPGGSPSLSPDGLLMPSGSRAGVVLALRDEGTHATLVWRRDDLVNRGVPTQAAGGIAYPTVSRGGTENDLVVIDTTTGDVLDREALPGTTAFSVGTTVGPDGTVYVPTFLGQLFAFRPEE